MPQSSTVSPWASTRLNGRLGALARWNALLGPAGLMIGLFSLLSFAFGVFIYASETRRPAELGRETLRMIVEDWLRAPEILGYRGLTLVDYAAAWQGAPPPERPARLAVLQAGLNQLGDAFDKLPEKLFAVRPLALSLRAREEDRDVANWNRGWIPLGGAEIRLPPIPLRTSRVDTGLDLVASVQLARPVVNSSALLQTSNQRLLLAILGLAGYSLLCLGYMVLHTQALRDRVARQSAQEATLDLADRTCHELGNVVFVLANERRNLAEHLQRVEQFLDQHQPALDEAAAASGLDPSLTRKFQKAFDRALAQRGLDPEIELRAGTAVAHDVCRQIDICSDFIALTVRELDTYLKQSTMPVALEPLDVEMCLDDALALLRPRLESALARVVRESIPAPGTARARADRRLLVHALINLLKNAQEAAGANGGAAEITLGLRVQGPWLEFTIADNGPGIPAADLPRIFDLGFSTKGAGRGRGLAIVRDSILAQGGRLLAANRPTPQSGAVFTILLPRAEPE